jgi:hypothetical protein
MTRRSFRTLPLLTLLTLGFLTACGSDTETGPIIHQVILIRDTTYSPSTAVIQINQRVEWRNASRELRTVTSGTGPDDPTAGDDFDVDLNGYPSGEPYGGRYQMVFTEADTIHYFSRSDPTFDGTIIVTS